MTDEAQPVQPDQSSTTDDQSDDQRQGRAFEPTRERPDPNRIEPREADEDRDEDAQDA